MFIYECPRCGEMLETDAEPGTPEVCPACRRRHKIPAPLSERIRKTTRTSTRARTPKKRRRPGERAERTDADQEPEPSDEASESEVGEVATAHRRPRPAATGEPPAKRPRRAPSCRALRTYAILLRVTAAVLWLAAAACLVLLAVRAARGEAEDVPAVAGLVGIVPGVAMAVAGLLCLAFARLLLCVRDIAITSFHVLHRGEAPRNGSAARHRDPRRSAARSSMAEEEGDDR